MEFKARQLKKETSRQMRMQIARKRNERGRFEKKNPFEAIDERKNSEEEVENTVTKLVKTNKKALTSREDNITVKSKLALKEQMRLDVCE